MLQYLSDVRDGRDVKEHPNKITKLGNADSRIWNALNPELSDKNMNEPVAQLCAMDLLDRLFFSPALAMITSPVIDVINVGPQWIAAHNWLTNVVPKKTDDEIFWG